MIGFSTDAVSHIKLNLKVKVYLGKALPGDSPAPRDDIGGRGQERNHKADLKEGS